jgi:hypothetical protein
MAETWLDVVDMVESITQPVLLQCFRRYMVLHGYVGCVTDFGEFIPGPAP